MSESTEVYTSKVIKITSLVEAVRKRLGMYFGNDIEAGNNLAFELIANAIDQCLANKATHVRITITDRSIIVEDDGEGIPFGEPAVSEDSDNLAEQYFMHRVDKPTADNHTPHIHIGIGGLGLAIVNAGCIHIHVTSVRDGKTWQQTFGQGKILSKASSTATNINDDIDLIKGTRIKATLDDDLFAPDCFDLPKIRKEVFELCHLFPNLKMSLNEETFFTQNGLLDLAVLYGNNWSSNRFHCHKIHEGVEIHAAYVLQNYSETDETVFYSWANGLRTNLGGTHVEGLRNAFIANKLTPATAMISVLFHEPRYAGPTKEELASPKAQTVVETLLTKTIAEWKQNLNEELT